MTMHLEIEGLDELIDKIGRIEQITKDAEEEALISGGDFLKEKIKSEVYSHGLTRRTGQAQEAIIRTDPKNGELFVGTQGGNQAPGFYLYMHEFGYYNVWARLFIAPKPLVSVVFVNNKQNILNEYANVLKRRYANELG